MQLRYIMTPKTVGRVFQQCPIRSQQTQERGKPLYPGLSLGALTAWVLCCCFVWASIQNDPSWPVALWRGRQPPERTQAPRVRAVIHGTRVCKKSSVFRGDCVGVKPKSGWQLRPRGPGEGPSVDRCFCRQRGAGSRETTRASFLRYSRDLSHQPVFSFGKGGTNT